MRNHILKSLRILAAAVPMLALAQPVVAQRSGSYEFSLGGGATYLATDFATYMGSSGLANGAVTPGRFVPGGVARIGYNISRHWGLGGGVGAGMGSGVSYLTPFAAFTYTANLNASTSPFLTFGTQFTRISGNDRVTHSVWGTRAGLGVRHMVTDHVALRAEARMGFEHYAAMPGSKMAYNPMLTLGFSYFTAGRRAPPEAIPVPCPVVVQSVRVDTVWRTAAPLPPLPPIVLRDTLVLEGVNFEFNSPELTKESHWILDRVATAMLQAEWTKSRWQIAGHTSSIGTTDYNMSLSQRRAESVRAYLVLHGVPDWRLSPKGYGETEPKFPEAAEGDNWKNRRVELRRQK